MQSLKNCRNSNERLLSLRRSSTATNGCTMTCAVPISIRRRGGRKLVLAPDGAEVTAVPVTRHVDNAMVKAIARAFRWREMLENGSFCTIAEVAATEKINETYVGRVLHLTLLAPEIVEAIVNERLRRQRAASEPGLSRDRQAVLDHALVHPAMAWCGSSRSCA